MRALIARLLVKLRTRPLSRSKCDMRMRIWYGQGGCVSPKDHLLP